jgi:hypothetical protein
VVVMVEGRTEVLLKTRCEVEYQSEAKQMWRMSMFVCLYVYMLVWVSFAVVATWDRKTPTTLFSVHFWSQRLPFRKQYQILGRQVHLRRSATTLGTRTGSTATAGNREIRQLYR